MSRRVTPKSLGVAPEFKLWLSCPDARSVFGFGKWQLLEAIRREGSLQAAAASVGISYRKAWGDLRAAEKALGIEFVERRRGGSEGGETRLTPAGLEWLREFGRMHARVEKSVEKAFAQWNDRKNGREGGRCGGF